MGQQRILPLLDPDGAEVWQITGAGSRYGRWQTDLGGITAVRGHVEFDLGASAPGSLVACVQSSIDLGVTAYDIAVCRFTAASRHAAFAVQPARNAVGPPISVDGLLQADGSPTPEGVMARVVLGDRLRLCVIVAASFAGASLAAHVLPSYRVRDNSGLRLHRAAADRARHGLTRRDLP